MASLFVIAGLQHTEAEDRREALKHVLEDRSWHHIVRAFGPAFAPVQRSDLIDLDNARDPASYPGEIYGKTVASRCISDRRYGGDKGEPGGPVELPPG